MLLDEARLAAVARARRVLSGGNEGLQRLTQLATDVLHVDYGFLSLVAGDLEVLLAAAGPGAERIPTALPAGQSVCRHLVESGRPLLVPDLQAHPALRDLHEIRALGLRGYAGSPVTGPDGLVLGGFCVGHGAARDWTPGEAMLLEGLADAATTELGLLTAVAELDAVRAIERRRAEEQGALRRVASAVARGDSPELVLQQVAEELTTVLDVDQALVLRFASDGRAELAASAGVGATAGLAAVDGCLNALARVRAGAESAQGADGDAPCAAVPVRINGRIWGAVVALTSQEAQRAVTAHLEQLADFVRLVVVNTDAQAQLSALARTDPLTGAANRRAFDERLAEELERAARHGSPLVLGLLDVDRFKQVNDGFGHDTGDRVLRELTGRVGQHLRAADLLARIGGDEWALLLPQTDQEAAEAVVQRIRHDVAALPLGGVPVTVTIGAAAVPDGFCTPQALYRAADAALYAAKDVGRDRVVVRQVE